MPAFLQVGPAAMDHLIPVGGAGKLLDLQLPWTTLIGESPQPGYLGRIGPITPSQARHLADLAVNDPATRWRIILTSATGQAIATTWLTRPATDHHRQAGLIKHITVTFNHDLVADTNSADTNPADTNPADTNLASMNLTGADPGNLPPAMGRILVTARHLAGHAARQAARDALTDDLCAHDNATTSYRPTTRLRDYITARDQTCRFPTCRQPAWRCDADHTRPFDQGGRTCSCNLGGLCRFHHQVKGRARWHLDQAIPGTFTWTTPTGRRYAIQPDSHAA